MRSIFRSGIVLIIATAFLLGCIPKIIQDFRVITVKPNIRISSRDKIPCRIGLFIPDTFRDHTFIIHQEAFRGTIEVGKSITVPFYSSISSIFEGVVFLEDYSPGRKLTNPEVPLILLAKIDEFQWKFRASGPASKMEATLILDCEFYDPGGHLVDRITTSGKRSESTMSMAFSGLNSVESAEKPTREVFEDVLHDIPLKILAEKQRLEAIAKRHSSK